MRARAHTHTHEHARAHRYRATQQDLKLRQRVAAVQLHHSVLLAAEDHLENQNSNTRKDLEIDALEQVSACMRIRLMHAERAL